VWKNLINTEETITAKPKKESFSEITQEQVKSKKPLDADQSVTQKITSKPPPQKQKEEKSQPELRKSQTGKEPKIASKRPESSPKNTQKPAPISTAPSMLKFSSFPAADVFWNDIKLGNTTQIFFKKFNPGQYIFKFIIPDYQAIEKEVTVEPDTEITVHQKFPPYGTITITAKPYARFFINQKDYGNNPIFKKKIPVGEYIVKAVKKGYITELKQVVISPRKLTNIYFELKKEKNNEQ
jgi:hypothetical protein